MTSTKDQKKPGKWGRRTVRKHHAGYEVRVSAGTDPVTGRRMVLQGTASTVREAEKLRTKLLAEADTYRSARTNASLGHLLDRWLPQHDVDENTRESYESLIRVHIRPGLGDVALTALVRKSTETVEQSYGCRTHVCRPLAAATVGRIHVVLSAACRPALRWGWIPFKPMDAVRQPSKPKPSPRPPMPAETARLVEEATRQSPEWGPYLWLAVVSGARRGEMLALRPRSRRGRHGGSPELCLGREKDPKNQTDRALATRVR